MCESKHESTYACFFMYVCVSFAASLGPVVPGAYIHNIAAVQYMCSPHTDTLGSVLVDDLTSDGTGARVM